MGSRESQHIATIRHRAKQPYYQHTALVDNHVAHIDGWIFNYLLQEVGWSEVKKTEDVRRSIIAVVVTEAQKKGIQDEESMYRMCKWVFNEIHGIKCDHN